MRYQLSRQELRSASVSAFKSGDIIYVSRYAIHIEWGRHSSLPLASWVEDSATGRVLSCWPIGVRGCWTRFIASFLRRVAAADEAEKVGS